MRDGGACKVAVDNAWPVRVLNWKNMDRDEQARVEKDVRNAYANSHIQTAIDLGYAEEQIEVSKRLCMDPLPKRELYWLQQYLERRFRPTFIDYPDWAE